MSWYKQGSVTLTQGSPAVVGSGSLWALELAPGDLFTQDGEAFYEVLSIQDNTHLTLGSAFRGATAANVGYAVITNLANPLQTDTLHRFSNLLDLWTQRETEMVGWLTGSGTVTVHTVDGASHALKTPKQLQADVTTAIGNLNAYGIPALQAQAQAARDAATAAASDAATTLASLGTLPAEMADTRAKAVQVASLTAEAKTARDQAITARAGADSAVVTAQAHATTVQTAKTAAETAATTATAKATEATTAATTAESAKTAAETARTGAEFAKTSADNAKTAAETAKNGADTARTGADAARDSAQAWASSLLLVDGVSFGAKKYAQDASNDAALTQTAKTAAETAASTATTQATAAGASAATATTKASEASTSADMATTKATAAGASAATATAKASEASTSAATATTKATEASTSASAAETAKAAAETSKVAAEAAKTGAETAKAGAESAKTGADAAKVAAETARDLAQAWAVNLTLVDGTNYGAKKYAQDAQYWASQAQAAAGVGNATETVAGFIELATTAETLTGTDAVRAVTPAGLKAKIDALVGAAPGALDTLNELAAALGNDPNFAATLTTALAGKLAVAQFDWAQLPGKPTTFAPSAHGHTVAEVSGLQSALDSKLAATAYTAADVLAKVQSVDGAGSGLDADLLDGQDGAFYRDYAHLTNKPVLSPLATTPNRVSTDQAAVAGTWLVVDTSGAARSIGEPFSPQAGQRFALTRDGGNYLYFTGKVNGDATGARLVGDKVTVIFEYVDATTGWRYF